MVTRVVNLPPERVQGAEVACSRFRQHPLSLPTCARTAGDTHDVVVAQGLGVRRTAPIVRVKTPAGGGLVLTYLLFVSRLGPRPIALLGLVGYACLAVGVPLDLLGVLSMDSGAGQALLVPGALFEALVLPIWLLAKGFQTPLRARTAAAPTLAPTR